MSTLKTINIIHPSGSTNNIVNDASGNITVGNNATVTGGLTVTGTLTGSTGVMNIGSGQLYKDASGNVGVGTSSPTTIANYKSVTVSSAAGGGWVEVTNGTVRGVLQNGVGDATLETRSNHPLIFGTNSTERGRFDTSGNFLFNSGYGSVATAYGCRAWANWDSSGTIRASGGTTSITKNGTGNWTMNFNFTMVDANYSCQATCQRNTAAIGIAAIYGSATYNTLTTTTAQIMTREDSNTAIDPVATCVAIFR
jgi:hypothetical protein